MERYKKTIAVVILMLIFTVLFLHNVKTDFHLIFKKDLLAHDESSNSVVAANITRKFFPPMVRVNPLNQQQGNWMEGPNWQHIPPLFAYVPYLFIKLDGQVTVEIKRLSYALITWLTGLLFIWVVYRFQKSVLAAGSAALAAILWINTPFTRELITGYAFGVSDIVLALTVVCGFGGILWYLDGKTEERKEYPYWKFIAIGLVVALPIMAKNLLGAIPAATFFGLLLWDRRKIDQKILVAAGSFLGFLGLYFLPLFFSSPETFKKEILVSFLHFNRLEGWGRPWYFYLSDYLPQRYLGKWTEPYYAGFALAITASIKYTVERKDKVLFVLSGGWFLWNLAAITLVTSKVPNFIYQGYLFSLFFIVYSSLTALSRFLDTSQLFHQVTRKALAIVLIFSLLVTGYEVVRFAKQFKVQRAQAYSYQTEHEKFYQTAEEMRKLGINDEDIIIVRVSDNDCWFRYYPLFLTGTESKTLLEMYFGYDASAIKSKYKRMFFIANKTDRISQAIPNLRELTNYTLYQFDLADMSSGQINDSIADFIADHNDERADIPNDIFRIKKDKTSCQWLVPDPILNAP